MLGKVLNAAEVFTFDYPCEFLGQLVLTSASYLSLLSLLQTAKTYSFFIASDYFLYFNMFSLQVLVVRPIFK